MVLIDKTYDMSKIHLFKNSTKSLLSELTMKKLKNSIKENIVPPKKDTKVFTLEFAIDIDSDIPLRIVCAQFTLTPKLVLGMRDDDLSQTIRWTKDELKKYGFKKIYLKKIIYAVKNDLLSYENLTDSITHVLEVTK